MCRHSMRCPALSASAAADARSRKGTVMALTPMHAESASEGPKLDPLQSAQLLVCRSDIWRTRHYHTGDE